MELPQVFLSLVVRTWIQFPPVYVKKTYITKCIPIPYNNNEKWTAKTVNPTKGTASQIEPESILPIPW